MIKLDLHTHSIASPDGGLNAEQYHQVIESKKLDCVAVTDHNRIDFALALREKLGPRIIVGEEIMTTVGEVIGLYLEKVIIPGLTLDETLRRIKEQGGLVYIPHPFETVRKGLSEETLSQRLADIDIVEVCNGRAFFQNRSEQAVVWAKLHNMTGAASSDAHGFKGVGLTYTSVSTMPVRETLVELLKSGTAFTDRPAWRALLYPKYNRLRNRVRRAHV